MASSYRFRLSLPPRLFRFMFAVLFMLSVFQILQAQDVNAGEGEEDQGSSFEPDADSGTIAPPTRKPYNRFNRFMKTVNEFFTEGNWLNGGPDNLLSYIGRTLSKLIGILLSRETPDFTGMAGARPPARLPPQARPTDNAGKPEKPGQIANDSSQPHMHEGDVPMTNDGFAGYREQITKQMTQAGLDRDKTQFTMGDIMKLVNIAEQLNKMHKDADKLNGISR